MAYPNFTVPYMRPKISQTYQALTDNYVNLVLTDVDKVDKMNTLWNKAPDLGLDGLLEEYLFFFIAERVMHNGIEIDMKNFAKHHINLSREDISDSEKAMRSLIYTGDKSIAVNMGKDNRVHYHIDTFKTATYRMIYSNPNLSSVSKQYRDIFKAKDGYAFVKTDANALHPRILANYLIKTGHNEMAEDIKSGDYHSANMKRFNVASRDDAKRMFYKMIYSNDRAVIEAIPGLSAIVKRLEDIRTKRDYIRALDERVVYVPDKSVLLCYLCQAAEAVIMKRMAIIIDELCINNNIKFSLVDPKNYDYEFALFNHDEIVIEVKDCYTDLMQNIIAEAYKLVTSYYYLDLPIEGGITVMKNL